jgi:Ser/Thr protein kinase RdoA (MazF antagonist)
MARQFASTDGRIIAVAPFGSGNVNDTYLAVFRKGSLDERFVLQRLNPHVFSSPENVMDNMKVVTDHALAQIEREAATADRAWQMPHVIPSRDGEDFVVDDEGRCWRAISLVTSARAYTEVQGPEHAHEIGLVLGHFQRLISGIPLERMEYTLPGFHITPAYLGQFDSAIAEPEGQVLSKDSPEAEDCCRFIEQRRDLCSLLEDAKERGELELRLVHGDPKVSNIMIDEATGKSVSIVDLDTVQPGLVHYDFGDCLRSGCNPAGEETLDLDAVRFDTRLCEAMVRGYMTAAGSLLSRADRHYLYDCIRLITFELGLRFFADYIAGNRYFRVRYRRHNLNRATVQFRLCACIEELESEIRGIVERSP